MEEDSLLILELIDDIQRLGLAHRFESGIKKALDNLAFIIDGCNTMSSNMSLHEVALCFRLLRQNGYFVSHDVFKDLVSDKNNEALLKGCGHEDVRDMLSLYDASYLAYQGEDILDKAREHATERLNTFLMEISSSNGDENMEELVRHSLEVPLHRRMVMLEARWYIEAYKKKEGANMALLELAKLEFNMAQSVLQGDLKVSSRWWNNLGLAKELSFSRDRLVESFFWTVGMMFEPRFSSCRKDLTQVTDINVMSSMPKYMKLCFLAFYNTINEMGYEALKNYGHNTIPYLTKAWAGMLKAFLKEAKWSSKECNPPTFSEYMENAWISVSGAVILVHTYCHLDDELSDDNINYSKEALCHLMNSNEMLRWPSIIFRLCNDLATSSEEIARGETVNDISCYMNETGVSEEHAREHMKYLIDEAWKNMNEGLLLITKHEYSPMNDHVFSKSFLQSTINLARISHYTYHTGDSHGAPDAGSKKRVMSLLMNPIKS
ncbi:unnamed protein product [Linum tenue]|uniref:Uncharacterized protein n=1 Tax=Linum tenue TaxID=586396 RepID=A0AAV0QYE8_9ROSI|nr:unnamed protein product [Linum tenue]